MPELEFDTTDMPELEFGTIDMPELESEESAEQQKKSTRSRFKNTNTKPNA